MGRVSTRKLSSPIKFAVCFLTILSSATGQSHDNNEITQGVFALPEINIKLRNGTALQVEPNSPVVLSHKLDSIELTCTADYPIKWEYLVKNKTIPAVDVVYRRVILNSSDFSNPKRSRFMALIILRGLLESQTGKYLCRHYNERLENNSYAVSSYFDVFIPGNKTFNTIVSVKFMNKTGPYLDIHCPVTDPGVHVSLYKLNEKHFNKTKEIVWKPIYAPYEPTDGFRLLGGLGRELLGIYNCTADNGASVVSIVADPSQKELYLSTSLSSLNSSCWENFKFVQYIRSKRLECYCQDSYGLFVNDNYEFENRQASCSLPSLLNEVKECADWRIDEFFRNEEQSRDVCFRERTQFELDGSGSRPSLKVNGEKFPLGTAQQNFSFTRLTVTYNGFVDWAGDFKIAVCRHDSCVQDKSERPANDETHFDNKTSEQHKLEFLESGPSLRQYFPLAHYQAVWNDLIVNGTDIKQVYVFQANSLSYAWFPYSTADIEWNSTTPSDPASNSSSDSDSSIVEAASSSTTVYYRSKAIFSCFLSLTLVTIVLSFSSTASLLV